MQRLLGRFTRRLPALAGHDGERGAILLLTAVILLGSVTTAAIMVDLAAARNDRSVNQMSADSAATAGALTLAAESGPAACESAIAYLDLHIDPPLTGDNCLTFPVVCTDATPPATTTASNGDIDVTIKHPVDDSDPLMGSALLGAPTVTVSSRDGNRCNRVAVVIAEDREIFFGAAINDIGGTTVVNAVATAGGGSDKFRPINLLALNRTDCETISVNGGGSNGGIIVGSITDPVSGEVLPGVITADSDGSNCKSNNAVIRANGSKATIRADGPPGCPGEVTSGTGEGCGSLEVFVDAGPGCVAPACSSGGSVAPAPQKPSERLTRAQIDWAFNCKATYPSALDIKGCPNTPSPAYLDELIAAVGTSGAPIGFRDYRGEGYDCDVGKKKNIVVPVGNWWVDCDLEIKGTLTFDGGNMVIDGNIELQSSGSISFNHTNNETLSWWPGATFNHRDHSTKAAYIFMRDGEISKTAQGSLSFNHTMVYMADKDARIDFGGGSGSTSWTAPTDGPFSRLALWSEGTKDHELSGGSSLVVDGIVFLPNATMSLQGGGSTTNLAAQFIADKVQTGGNGLIRLAPSYNRMVLFPVPGGYTELIR